MKLAVSAWYPYQHQAAALQQLVGDPIFELVSLESVSSSLLDAALGPFIAVLDDDAGLPLLGLPTIAEALDRKYPARGFLGDGPIGRARVRALAAMVEERFSRLCIAAIASHEKFGQRIWNVGSDAPVRVLGTPPPVSSVESQQTGKTSRFLVGERPSIADCLLAALWWTAQDQGVTAELADQKWLSKWYERNCTGQPFGRVHKPPAALGANRENAQ